MTGLAQTRGQWAWEPAGEHGKILQTSRRAWAALHRLAETLPAAVTTTDPQLRAVALHLLVRGSNGCAQR